MSQSAEAPSHVLPIEAPLRLVSAESVPWDGECDVLVAGLGAAGAAAAITAREAGADVRIAERFDGGGATVKSGGIVYLGGGTRYQIEAGYADTPEAMFNYLRQECGDAVSEATLRAFCAGSSELLAWLESIGVTFQSCPQPPKTSYPKDGTYLYFSGNEAVPAYAAKAPPAPRGHRVKAPGIDSGRELYAALCRRVEALGIPIWRQTAVRRLILDADGAIIGAELARLEPGSAAQRAHRRLIRRAEALHNVLPARADRLRAQALALEQAHARPVRVRARRGVVLATGGFIFNREMVRQHAGRYLPAMRLGATGCDGSGIRLGLSVGAVAARMDRVSAWRFINPPSAWPRGIVVGPDGRRFCNEQVYGAKLGVEMVERAGGRAWLILDARLRRAALREALFGRLWFFQSVPALLLMLLAPRARSIEALARKLGLPPEPLRATVDAYNAAARGQREDEYGKSPELRAALAHAPYYAMDISAGSKTFPCPAITLGGLVVDEVSGAVLNEHRQPIAGLYAAGRTAVGIASHRYVSGLSLADCLWSGRRAGRHAAARTD
ncbi:3-oxo-5alpha-steroid 4-dehydrogenase [Fontimonas thermophila]|uniref:3-oxo-5alpha-steroid 4-dehydrogenase n=1 Tax=Fontimonas thermophila TaxID=1076937 RepID=A0A1I2KDE5_9GAMM|nr:FAD-binding protein [Fontimonas thermophila]SFF64388.1 3-oxo-5alpha-steroid 4-dehydrogenase [Fontimonas thermophila]